MNNRTIAFLLILGGLIFTTHAQSLGRFPCVMPGCPDGVDSNPGIIDMLAIERSNMPASLLGKSFYHSIPNTKNGSGIVCGVNAMCASFPVAQSGDVMAWIGFDYQDEDGELFIATSGEEAFQVDDTTYALPLWEEKHFWITVDQNSAPLAIQPRYAATDIITGFEVYIVDFLGYKLPGVDYSAFQFEMSVSSLIVVVDPDEGSIEDLYIDYYDENNDYVESIDINNGDQIMTFFLGLDKISPDTVTFFSIEDPVTVTQTPELFYEEWYPGTTFPCTYCGVLDLSQVQFKYIFESIESFPRINYTDPLPIIDEIIFRNNFE